jgi:hypothetical protein
MARRVGWALIAFVATVLVAILLARAQSPAPPPARPRVVITADPELDDTNTLIRALLYSSKRMVKGDRTDYFGLTGFTADELRNKGYYVWTPPGPKGAFIGEGDTPTFAGPGAAADAAPGPNTPVGPDFPGFGFGLAPAGSTANAPTTGLKDANHEPPVKIASARDLDARSGDAVSLRGIVSDPDGNRVTTRWWQDYEAGTYPGDITVADANATVTTFRVPADARAGQTIHLILEATDDGAPTLTRYQRIIVTVRP